MDPNLFAVDWERAFEVFVAIVLASFLMERALSVIFENRLFIQKAKDKGLKEFIALALGIFIAVYWDFDAVSVILVKNSNSLPGKIITGAVIAGGSKASIKLFRDVMGLRSLAEDARIKAEQKKNKPANS